MDAGCSSTGRSKYNLYCVHFASISCCAFPSTIFEDGGCALSSLVRALIVALFYIMFLEILVRAWFHKLCISELNVDERGNKH
jgi:hypothetical protein